MSGPPPERRRVEPVAVVEHASDESVVVPGELDPNDARVRVRSNVGEGRLNGPEQDDLRFRRWLLSQEILDADDGSVPGERLAGVASDGRRDAVAARL
jgi:hypothetical protein